MICKILNTPHVGGLDRRAIIILGIDSMEVVAYAEIPADEELELLTEMDSAALNLDIVKVSMDEMENFLQERMGIGLDEINENQTLPCSVLFLLWEWTIAWGKWKLVAYQTGYF